MDTGRLVHGAIWGMVATLIAAILPIWLMAFSVWPAPEPVTPAVIARLFDWSPSAGAVWVLAGVWQLAYGAFWGAFLAYASGPIAEPLPARPSPISCGLGVGFFRAYVANLTAVMYLDWGPFALLVTPKIAVGILLYDLAFGVIAGWLLVLDQRGRIGVRPPRWWTRRRLAAQH